MPPQIAFKTRKTITVKGRERVATLWAVRSPYFSQSGIDPIEPFPTGVTCPIIDLTAVPETIVNSIIRRYMKPEGIDPDELDEFISLLIAKGGRRA